jgi:two-component sensor histidine kinase
MFETLRNFYSPAGLFYIFLVHTAIGLLQFWYRYLDTVTRAKTVPWLEPFIEQMTGNWVSFSMLVLLVTPAVLWFRPDLSGAGKLFHAGLILPYSAIHTSLMWGSRVLLFPLFGLGEYDYGIMPVRYWMELPSDLISYVWEASALVVYLRIREANANKVRLAELEGDLARARLETLSLQLQPHFLFNSMNVVTALIHEDPKRADLMLSRLAGYLRRTLQSGPEQRVRLEQELETLDLYLSMMKARFEDNLTLQLNVEECTKKALAPQLILQPIVENAIQHGFDPASSKVQVEVSATRLNGDLVLQIRDRGRGVDAAASPRIGLANTRNRLQHLYGSRASCRIGNAEGGGAEVEIRLPFEESGA